MYLVTLRVLWIQPILYTATLKNQTGQ